MTIYKDKTKVLNSWDVYSAEEFDKVFKTGTKFDYEESDEEYIMEHLKKDKRLFRATFHDNDNPYEEYWTIEEIQQ